MVFGVVETTADQTDPHQKPHRGANARGNVAQRRADVLASAAEILDESGWAGLSIRDVAARSGVSAGAVYQWFSGKDEIFAVLYASRLNGIVEVIYHQPDEIGLNELTANLFSHVSALWAGLGRYELDFTAEKNGNGQGGPSNFSTSFDQLSDLIVARLGQAARVDGHKLPRDEHLSTWFWAAANGAAQRIVAMRFDDAQTEEFIAFAAASFVSGAIESA